jgi:hypothetical protein
MKLVVQFLGVIVLSAMSLASAQQTQPWKKTCTFGTVGSEGCTVKIRMKIAPGSPCAGGIPEYCVKIKVSCPAGIPPGDPGEDCEDESCEYCGYTATPATVTCDGQAFYVRPKTGMNWEQVAADCGNAETGITT